MKFRPIEKNHQHINCYSIDKAPIRPTNLNEIENSIDMNSKENSIKVILYL